MIKKDINLLNDIMFCITCTIFIIVFSFPIFWMILTSFKNPGMIGGISFLFKPVLQNYKIIIQDWEILKFLKNSIVVTFFSALIANFVGALAAYSLVRLNPAGKNFIAFEFLSLRAIPPIISLIPIFILSKLLKMQGSLFLLIFVYICVNLPFVIWMLAGFISEIPKSIEEAALIDGCTQLEVFIKVTLPLMVPGLIATSIITSIFCWNEFMFANILTLRDTKTLPIIASMSIKHYSIAWGPACASGVICAIPVIILGLLTQKYLVRGLTLGAIK
jgi:multiple sugar transport system permease protein